MRTPKRKHLRWLVMVICLLEISMVSACTPIAVDNPVRPSAGTPEQELLSPGAHPATEVAAQTTLGFNIRGWT